MSYKIVIDSCGEIPKEFPVPDGVTFLAVESIPLGLEVGEYCVQDDETLDTVELMQKIAAYPLCPKSSCPSPERYLQAFQTEADNVYCITLSSHLSGSHNSAVLAKQLYHEQFGDKNIHIIDSESASGGETQIAFALTQLENQGLSFTEIVKEIEAFRDRMITYFVLDNLDTLRKNGRLSGVKSIVASTLNIKPIMSETGGVIEQRSQSIGLKKALRKMAEMVVKEMGDTKERRLIISHCNAPERAEVVKAHMLEIAEFAECIIMPMRGLSSLYANEGGIIVTV